MSAEEAEELGEVVAMATVTSSEEDVPSKPVAQQAAMSARASAFSIDALMADQGMAPACSAVRCCSVQSTDDSSSISMGDSDCFSSASTTCCNAERPGNIKSKPLV